MGGCRIGIVETVNGSERRLCQTDGRSEIDTWGKILPHNWVPYDVFSARKEQVPGGISPE
jgi:hypothetical protein